MVPGSVYVEDDLRASVTEKLLNTLHERRPCHKLVVPDSTVHVFVRVNCTVQYVCVVVGAPNIHPSRAGVVFLFVLCAACSSACNICVTHSGRWRRCSRPEGVCDCLYFFSVSTCRVCGKTRTLFETWMRSHHHTSAGRRRTFALCLTRHSATEWVEDKDAGDDSAWQA